MLHAVNHHSKIVVWWLSVWKNDEIIPKSKPRLFVHHPFLSNKEGLSRCLQRHLR